ncbi:uncharacterized protein VTP21DRAFT_7962 [Calcarisporiella thermophila]|uniref:uncharacterized protein n=1 Tax=Calcarisporiella thermophila TaxID=911321 RepID=UPI0037447C1B
MSRFSALDQNTPEEDGQEESVEFFQLRQLNAGALIQVSDTPFTAEDTPSHVSLFAVSNKYGYFVAATQQGFVFDTLQSLRNAFKESPKQEITKLKAQTQVAVSQGHVHHLRISADQLTVIVTVGGGNILMYNLEKLAQWKPSMGPEQVISLGESILDVRPNPGDNANIFAVLLASGQVKLMDMKGGLVATLEGNNFTSICWSPKGKRVVCGTREATLVQYAPDGARKKVHSPPPSVASAQPARSVQDVLWLENAVFVVAYASPDDETQPVDVYVISEEDKNNPRYINFREICMSFGAGEWRSHYYFELIRNWGSNAKHIVLSANIPSIDISVLGHNGENAWQLWILDETHRASMPLSKETDLDTVPLGLALDFTSSDELPPLAPEIDETPIPPVPILYVFNNEGMVSAYHCLNIAAVQNGERCAGMTPAQPIPMPGTIASAAPLISPPTPAERPKPVAPLQTPSASSAAPSSSSPFAMLGSGSAFGSSSSFGTVSAPKSNAQASTPSPFSFAGNSPFAAASAATGGTSPFATAAPSPFSGSTFGAQTPFGAAKSSAPAFGQSGFGFTGFGGSPAPAFPTTTTPAAPAFGSTAFSFAALGQQAKETTTKSNEEPPKPVFSFGSIAGALPAENTALKPTSSEVELEKEKEAKPESSTEDVFVAQKEGVQQVQKLPESAVETEVQKEKDGEGKDEKVGIADKSVESTAELSFNSLNLGELNIEAPALSTTLPPSAPTEVPEAKSVEPTEKHKESAPSITVEKPVEAPTISEEPKKPEEPPMFKFGPSTSIGTFSFNTSGTTVSPFSPATTKSEPSAPTTSTPVIPSFGNFNLGGGKAETKQEGAAPVVPATTAAAVIPRPTFGDPKFSFGEKADNVEKAPKTPSFPFGDLGKPQSALPAAKELTGISFGGFTLGEKKEENKEASPLLTSSKSLTQAPTSSSFRMLPSTSSAVAPPPVPSFGGFKLGADVAQKKEPTPAPPSITAPTFGVMSKGVAEVKKEEKPAPTPAPGKENQDTARTAPATTEEVITKEFDDTYSALSRELSGLHARILQINDELCCLKRSSADIRSEEDLGNPEDWSLGDLSSLVQLVEKLVEEAHRERKNAAQLNREVLNMESDLLKIETKREEAARFLRARMDPEFAKLVKVRNLGPEQAEDQQRLRKAIQKVSEQIACMEECLAQMKEYVQEQKIGGSRSLRAPSLDTIHRVIRNISSAISDRAQELDELNTSLSRLSLGDSFATSKRDSGSPLQHRAALGASPSKLQRVPYTAASAQSTIDFLRKEQFASKLKRALAARAGPLENEYLDNIARRV